MTGWPATSPALGRDVPARLSRAAPTLPTGTDLSEPGQAGDFLAAAGIGVATAVVCADVEEAVAAAQEVRYPAVLKVVHPALSHKSDVGGVRLRLSDPAAVRRAAEELLAL